MDQSALVFYFVQFCGNVTQIVGFVHLMHTVTPTFNIWRISTSISRNFHNICFAFIYFQSIKITVLIISSYHSLSFQILLRFLEGEKYHQHALTVIFFPWTCISVSTKNKCFVSFPAFSVYMFYNNGKRLHCCLITFPYSCLPFLIFHSQ